MSVIGAIGEGISSFGGSVAEGIGSAVDAIGDLFGGSQSSGSNPSTPGIMSAGQVDSDGRSFGSVVSNALGKVFHGIEQAVSEAVPEIAVNQARAFTGEATTMIDALLPGTPTQDAVDAIARGAAESVVGVFSGGNGQAMVSGQLSPVGEGPGVINPFTALVAGRGNLTQNKGKSGGRTSSGRPGAERTSVYYQKRLGKAGNTQDRMIVVYR
jgi:hypothetical protein